jgi:nucleotide-binding universal stress UspA family protein
MTVRETTREGPSIADATSSEIVVGVDECRSAVAAVRWAAAECRGTGARLRVVHVVDPHKSSRGRAPSERILQAAVADARARATRCVLDALEADQSLPWILEVEQGDPAPVLVETSRRAALLVLGAGAASGGKPAPRGPVSRYCLRHAGPPVVTVATTAAPDARLLGVKPR